MKKFSLLLVFILANCSTTVSIEKPENLIDESLMVDLLYEISILDAMSTFKPINRNFEKVYGKSYVYRKFGVDSLQLNQSDNYYANFPRVYHRIYSRVLLKMNRIKDSLDLLEKNQKID